MINNGVEGGDTSHKSMPHTRTRQTPKDPMIHDQSSSSDFPPVALPADLSNATKAFSNDQPESRA